MTNAVNIAASGSNGGLVPTSWTTDGRPASPATGQMGFNTTNTKMEYYSGSAWVSISTAYGYYASLAAAQSAGLVQFWPGSSSVTTVSNLTGSAVGSPTVNNIGTFGGGTYPYINTQAGSTVTGYSYAGYSSSGNSALTMMMWVNQASTIGNESTFLQVGTFAGVTGEIFALGVNSSRQLRVITIGRDTTATSATQISASTWTHITAVYNGASTVTFYINGASVLAASTGGSLNVGTSGNAMYLGYANWNNVTSNKYSDSFLSDVAVFNVALSSTVISGIYTAGRLVNGY
jgi:hypothetical protein